MSVRQQTLPDGGVSSIWDTIAIETYHNIRVDEFDYEVTDIINGCVAPSLTQGPDFSWGIFGRLRGTRSK